MWVICSEDPQVPVVADLAKFSTSSERLDSDDAVDEPDDRRPDRAGGKTLLFVVLENSVTSGKFEMDSGWKDSIGKAAEKLKFDTDVDDSREGL